MLSLWLVKGDRVDICRNFHLASLVTNRQIYQLINLPKDKNLKAEGITLAALNMKSSKSKFPPSHDY